MITDSGDITDESFNQITWETVCAYGDANGVEYEYYKRQRIPMKSVSTPSILLFPRVLPLL